MMIFRGRQKCDHKLCFHLQQEQQQQQQQQEIEEEGEEEGEEGEEHEEEEGGEGEEEEEEDAQISTRRCVVDAYKLRYDKNIILCSAPAHEQGT